MMKIKEVKELKKEVITKNELCTERKFILTLSVPGDNTNLPLSSNISKTVRVNIVFTRTLFKEYLISFPIVCMLIDFALVVFKLLIFNVCGNICISKIKIFNSCGTEMVKQNRKKLKNIKNLLSL